MNLKDNILRLKELALQSHYSCEDTYYQCPHYDGDDWHPADYSQECNCGANEHNKKVEELWQEIIGQL